MQLMQILLVIPASFANSLLHKVTHFSQTWQKKAFGNLMSLSIWIGLYITALFTIFGTWIISLIGWTKYLTAWYILDRTWITSVLAHSHPLSIVYGADYMLPFLWLVLLCSFIKTVYNYIFISLDKHNTLLRVNLGWFVVGAPITWYLVMHYHLIGAGIGQIIMEIAFVAFSMVYASRHHAIPIVSYRHIVVMSVYFVFVICLGLYIQSWYWLVVTSWLYRLIYMWFIAVLIALPRYGRVRSRLYLLSHDD
jgi:O-antigen/teichoic acid export membrane protein